MMGFGRSSGGKDLSPLISPSHSWVRIKLPSRGTAISKWFFSSLGSGTRKQDQRRAFLRLPMGFKRGDLGRLMLARVQPMQIADDELERREPHEQAQAHAEHDPPMRHAPSAQDVPGADAETMKAVVR